jgi:hypothetical protein
MAVQVGATREGSVHRSSSN